MRAVLFYAFVAFATLAHTWAKTSGSYITQMRHHLQRRGLNSGYSSGFDSLKPFNIRLEGKYSWEKLYYIDNRNQSSPYKETRTIIKKVSTSYSDLRKSVSDEALKLHMGMEVGGVFKIITAKVSTDNSFDVELSRSYSSTVEKKEENVVSEEVKKEFTVEANSIGEMFRLVYKGPGVTYATDTFSTNGNIPLEKVFIDCQVREELLLKDIRVKYTEQTIDKPENIITETLGGSPDINSGFGGKYVWLVAEWTKKTDEAVSNVQVAVQNESNDNYQDLAAGAGGSYRYLKMLKDSSSHNRVGRVGLLRSKSKDIYSERQKYGWDECTGDINSGRKGDYLHLCWNTVSIL